MYLAGLSLLGLSSCSQIDDAIAGGDISKSSYVAIESNSGRILFASNSNTKRPIGMLTNVATAIVIVDWMKARNIPSSRLITVPHEACRWPSTNLLQLQPGDQISVRDALYSTVLWEDSASAYSLAYACGQDINHKDPVVSFVKQMNSMARSIGMNRSSFRAPHGAVTSYATARDLILLGTYAHKKGAFQMIASQKSTTCTIYPTSGQAPRKVLVRNTNQLLHSRTDVDGLKTARSKNAGACLIATARKPSVKRKNPITGIEQTYPQNMTIVVLGMSPQNRYNAARAFLQDGWKVWEQWRASNDLTDYKKFILLPQKKHSLFNIHKSSSTPQSQVTPASPVPAMSAPRPVTPSFYPTITQ